MSDFIDYQDFFIATTQFDCDSSSHTKESDGWSHLKRLASSRKLSFSLFKLNIKVVLPAGNSSL